MKKHLLGIFISAMFVLTAWAQYSYTANSGEITITRYTGTSTSVNVPEKINGTNVTAIGNWAFEYNSNVTTVTLPNDIKIIGQQAFLGCNNLTQVSLGAGVIDIGSWAFEYCRSLKSIVIPDSVTSIGQQAFNYCSAMTNVVVGNGVTSIGDYAFEYCPSLARITIGNGVTSIGQQAFWGCNNLANVKIGTNVTAIGNFAFAYCSSMANITIPRSMTSIGQQAFEYCTSLKSIYFQGNPPSYGSQVFFAEDPKITTAYYLPTTTGWGNTYATAPSIPTCLWNPQIENLRAGTNYFGFNITGSSNLLMVVEACTNLINANWVAITNVTLGSSIYSFVDPQKANYPTRFYRINMP